MVCRSDIYSSTPIDGDGGNSIKGGTVGLILNGPGEGYREHFKVEFLNGIVWWVGPHEIEPYVGS